ncbi:MAG: ATP-binding protein [Syntrophobacteraceae bacterium]|nr:ATP-binding protein [Syntrophobacteraceae bacterium]
MKFPTTLNIRQKVMAAFVLLITITGSFGAVSFSRLRAVERKQHFVETFDDLRNYILEARRYEKNYLLYGLVDDLAENRRFTRHSLELFEKENLEAKSLKALSMLNEIKQGLVEYQQLMKRLELRPADRAKLQDQLRERGKSLVTLSQRLVSFERERILVIVGSLESLLLISLGVTILGGALLIPMISAKVVTPLRYIERITHRIAGGDLSLIAVKGTHDETQRVVEGFNKMISELEKRQEQLLQAKKLASLGTLTSGIAHQLNNPLNNISTSCQILLEEFDKADPEFSHRMLTNIEHEVHRARDIVRGLLEFAREKEFCLARSSLLNVVERAVKLISSQLPPGIEISLDVPGELYLNLDSHRMEQVFLNLFENAILAIDPPGQLVVKARPDPTSAQVLITVEDTGRGIPQTALGRIFDPFFTTREVGAGTGLGLSVVLGIVQKHRGSISVESKEGEGTRFAMRFPLEQTC